jgi:4,5-DOPA dioxygenase extradiol
MPLAMNGTMPTIFVSHGAPTLAIEDGPARTFLLSLGRQVPRPRAILCASAHWDTVVPAATGAPRPETIHDFFGFPEALYRLRYPVPGSRELAARAMALLLEAGVEGVADSLRGIDHGAWVPLLLAYPDAQVPVVQLSVQSRLDARHHLALGRALRPLREEGVLILGSGGASHNLRDFGGQPADTPPYDYAREFDDWLRDAILNGREAELLDYLQWGPQARRNHPTPEHFLPLFVALGAATKNDEPRALYRGLEYGMLSMAAYGWFPPGTGASGSEP